MCSRKEKRRRRERVLRARVPATGTVIKSAEGGQAGGNFDGAGGQGKRRRRRC